MTEKAKQYKKVELKRKIVTPLDFIETQKKVPIADQVDTWTRMTSVFNNFNEQSLDQDIEQRTEEKKREEMDEKVK